MAFQREKNLYNKSVVFSQKALSNNKASSNTAIKMLRQNKKIASVLDMTESQHLLNAMQAEAKGGSLKEDQLRKAFGKIIAEDKGVFNKVNKNEADIIGREVFGNRKRYIMPTKEKAAPIQSKNSPVMNPRGGSSPIAKPGSSSGKGFVSRPRLF